MKKWLSALLALVLCVSAGLAEVELPEPAEPPQDAATQQHAPEPQAHAPQTAASAPANASEEPPAGDAPAGAPKAEQEGAPEGAPESSPTDAPEASPEGEPEASPEEGSDDTAADPDGDPDGDQDGEAEAPGAQGESSPQEPADGAATLEGFGPDGMPLLDVPKEAAVLDEGYLEGHKDEPGKLAALLANPGEKTIYLLTDSVTIQDFKLALLKDVTLLPDPVVYSGEGYTVKLTDGSAEITPERIESATDETVTLTVSVIEFSTGLEGPTGIQIHVEAQNYKSGAWMNQSPKFLLSSIAADDQDYSYAALIYNERFIPLSGNSYTPTEEGIYTLRFAILNAEGDVVASSATYELKLDLTPPELMLEVSQTRDYTLILSAIDVPGGGAAKCSGVAEFSLDGGESWTVLGEGVDIMHTEKRKRTFPPNTILVCDAAGNVTGNAEEIVLDKLPDETVDFGGWGGDGGSSTPKPPHASGNGDDSPYASYELTLPDGAVDVLTLGGEEIDLGLQVDGAGPEAFTAELTAWTREGASEDAPPKDTLVIRAEPGAAGVPHAYAWRINGAVLRKLYNSDIDYLALTAGDAMLSLPTVGFTAGTKYAELKMGGISTAEFEYEIVMRLGEAPTAGDWNRSADCTVEISVTVNGERYDMIDRSATPEMYPYDVYCGPEDLPDYPYGAYPGTEMED